MAAAPLACLSTPWLLDQSCVEELCTHDQRDNGRGTHTRRWPAAEAFARWLSQNAQQVLGWSQPRPLQLLELGSGRGWLGLVVARNLPLARLTLTDLPEALPGLHAAVEEATSSGLSCRPVICALDWLTLKKQPEVEEQVPCGWNGQDVAKLLVAEQIKASPEEAVAQIQAQLRPEAPYDTVFGTDLCWDLFTCEALVLALSTFAMAASIAEGTSDAITGHLVGLLLQSGSGVRVLHPVGWRPSPGGFLSEILSQQLPPDQIFAEEPTALASTGDPKSSSASSAPRASPGNIDSDLDDNDNDEDYAAAMFDRIFPDDGPTHFPNPVFFVFEILAAPLAV
ncbi:unnamed protein product [Polarella glacialis]|uniref:Uncharacterized protein n=1 Tax=Polarella glacialis TaxID=89957 RepID=A0A813DV49_POLGL|nr:unnamed protein product [Polarella glacialis]